MRVFELSLTKRLLTGSVWAFFTKVGTGFLTIGLMALLTRILSPEEVGVIFLSFSIIIMISLLVRAGLDQLGIKLIGEALAEKKYQNAKLLTYRIMKLVALFSLLFPLLVYFLFDTILFYLFSFDALSQKFPVLFSLWITVTAIQLLFAEVFRAYHEISKASIFAGGTIFGGFVVGLITGIVLLLIYFLKLPFSVEIIMGVVITATSIILSIELYLIVKMVKIPNMETKLTPSNKEIIGHIQLLKQGFPFLITWVSLFALIHLDTVILGFYRNEEEVAVYVAASRVVKLIILSLTIAYEVVAPVIVELNRKNEIEKLQKVLRMAATAAAFPSTIILLLLILGAEYVLITIYGDYYKEGATVLIILSIGQLVNVWTGLCGYTLNMLGYQKLNMYIYSSVTVVALTACTFAAESYGSFGVAVIISLAWAIQNIIALLFVRYYTGLWTHASLLEAVHGVGILLDYGRKLVKKI